MLRSGTSGWMNNCFFLTRKSVLVFIIIILFFKDASTAQSGVVNVTLEYSGSDNLCQATECSDDVYFSHADCSSEFVSYFSDPIPKGYYLSSITVYLYGMFGCSSTEVLVILDGQIVGLPVTTGSSNNCSCSNCAVPVIIESAVKNNGWKGYVYGGNNTVNIFTNNDDTVCLSQTILSLSFNESEAVYKSTIPDLSPINTETPIKIFGSNFISSDSLFCFFGDISVPATLVDNAIINCTTPIITEAQDVSLSIQQSDNIIILEAGSFTFYEQPIITSIYPTSGSADGSENVYLYGSLFFNSSFLACRFGRNLAVDALYLNDSTVMCLHPKNAQSQTGNVSVEVSFSENRVQYISAPTNFTFISVPPIPSPSPTLSLSSSSLPSSSSPSPSPSSSPQTNLSPSPTNSVPGNNGDDGDQSKAGYWWVLIGAFLLLLIILLAFCLIMAAMTLKRKRNEEELPFGALAAEPGSGSSLLSISSQGSNDLSEIDPNAIPVHEIKNLRQIEKGSFGVIYEATWRGTIIAVKKLPSNMNQKLLKEFYQEAALMRSLRHPNILQYLGVANSGGEISICMEFMARGSLYRLLHTNSDFSRSKIKSICLDTAKGMNYLHQHRPPIIHRDLKSHNLLVDEHWRVKVCDFGLSRIIVQANATMTACGTPSWTAPEVLRNERYTTKADVYGFGVVVWEMFARADPFPGMPPFQIVFAVGNQGLRPLISPSWPKDWVKLITDCWAEDPLLRPTFEQIIVRIESLHPPTDDDE